MDNIEIYPRTVKIDNSKLIRLVEEKAAMVLNGRKISEDIEAVEQEMEKIDLEVQAIEATIEADDLKKEAEELTKEFNAVMAKMEDNQKELRRRLHIIVPQEKKDQYDAVKKTKEELEQTRNKIALKISKWNDKIIPLARKVMKVFIQNEYEDYDSLRLENGKVVGTIFNHLEDWKKQFLSKKKSK